MIPSPAEVQKAAWSVLNGDATLTTLTGGRIYTMPPQDTPFPMLRVRVEQATEWDTKDSDGYEGALVVDAWTDYRGDKEAFTIAERAVALLHLASLTMSTGQHLLLRREVVDRFTEPDGLTHHTMIRFRFIITN